MKFFSFFNIEYKYEIARIKELHSGIFRWIIIIPKMSVVILTYFVTFHIITFRPIHPLAFIRYTISEGRISIIEIRLVDYLGKKERPVFFCGGGVHIDYTLESLKNVEIER